MPDFPKAKVVEADDAKTATTAVQLVQAISPTGEIASGGYDGVSDSNKVSVIDRRQPEQEEVVEVLAAAAADGTTTFPFDLSVFPFHSIQMANKAGAGTVTITVEASNEPVVSPASAIYFDVTNALYGVANLAADGVLIRDGVAPFRLLRVKVVVAGSDAATAYSIWIHKQPGGQS